MAFQINRQQKVLRRGGSILCFHALVRMDMACAVTSGSLLRKLNVYLRVKKPESLF